MLVLNPAKLHENMFRIDFEWLPLAMAVKPRYNGQEKGKLQKVVITLDIE